MAIWPGCKIIDCPSGVMKRLAAVELDDSFGSVML
jgi:hypothetical protein